MKNYQAEIDWLRNRIEDSKRALEGFENGDTIHDELGDQTLMWVEKAKEIIDGCNNLIEKYIQLAKLR